MSDVDPDTRSAQPAEEYERERRQQALADLARRAGGATPDEGHTFADISLGSAPGRRTLRLRTVSLSILLATAVVASAVAAFALTHRTSAPATPAELRLNVTAQGICPLAVVWSPDGKRLAALGPRGSRCLSNPEASAASVGEALVVYDAQHGQVTRFISLESVLPASLILDEESISWSPDGKMLVILARPLQAAGQVGLVLIPAVTGAPRVILSTNAIQRSQFPQQATALWNIQVGDGTLLQNSPPPALAYQWEPGGQVIPVREVPQQTGEGIFSGSPVVQNSQGTFSVWQPGIIRSVSPGFTADLPPGPPVEFFVAHTTLWSADSHYVITDFPSVAALDLPPGTVPPFSPQDCAEWVGIFSTCGKPLYPFPDVALERVATQSQSAARTAIATGTNQIEDVPITWRSDGKVLAAILPGDGFDAFQKEVRVSLLRTDTGQLVGTFQTSIAISQSSITGQFLYWSPTGRQLALLDPTTGHVIIWRTDSKV